MCIQNVCVLGGGIMGRQIALHTAIYPYNVTIFDTNASILEDVACWKKEYLSGRIAKGRMTTDQVRDICDRFRICATLEEAVQDADLVIEAVVEQKEIKSDLFRKVSALTKKGTILATNSSRMVSSLFVGDVDEPQHLANLHFFNPALVMQLVEIVQGEHCSDKTVQALCDFVKSIGKTPILLKKEAEGFVVNRILQAIKNEARWLVENGYCTLQDVDTACEKGLNHPMGPFRLEDLSGIDLTYNIMQRQLEETGQKPVGYDLIKSYYDQGHYGRKTGRGFYDYK